MFLLVESFRQSYPGAEGVVPGFGGEFFEAAAGVESELPEVEATFDSIKIDTNKRDIFRKCFCKLEHFLETFRAWNRFLTA